MCFSATASFVAAATLLPIGAYALVKAKRKDRLIGAVPALFGIQQAIEGFQWLFVGASTPNAWLGYAFLFFAFLFWPWFIPLAVCSAEADPKKQRFIFLPLSVGFITCLALLALMIAVPMVITIQSNCIQYGVEIPLPLLLPIAAGYLFSACTAQLISGFRYLRLAGYLGLFATVFSFAVYWTVFTSVWCFFAAIISVICLLHVLDRSD